MDKKKTVRVEVKMTPEEKAKIQEKAKLVGRTLSSYIRFKALKTAILVVTLGLASGCGKAMECNDNSVCTGVVINNPQIPVNATITDTSTGTDTGTETEVEVHKTALYKCQETTWGSGEYTGMQMLYKMIVYSDGSVDVKTDIQFDKTGQAEVSVQKNHIDATDPNNANGRVKVVDNFRNNGNYAMVWIDRTNLVSSFYYYNAAGVPLHWESLANCSKVLYE